MGPHGPAEGRWQPIVVVDDDDLARTLIRHYLVKMALANPVLEAEDGERAVRLLSELPYPPALVLLDMHMPHRNGLEVLSWLRAAPATSQTPVVMLTGSAGLEDVDGAYALGVSSYLVKPVGFTALQDIIRQLGLPWALVPAGGPAGSAS